MTSCAGICGRTRACPVRQCLSTRRTPPPRAALHSRASRTTHHVCQLQLIRLCDSLTSFSPVTVRSALYNMRLCRLPADTANMGPAAKGEPGAGRDRATIPRAERHRDVQDVPAQVGVPVRVRRRRVREGLHHLPHDDVCESGECSCSWRIACQRPGRQACASGRLLTGPVPIFLCAPAERRDRRVRLRRPLAAENAGWGREEKARRTT